MEMPPSAGRVDGKTPEKGKGEGGREGRERQRKERRGGGGRVRSAESFPSPYRQFWFMTTALLKKSPRKRSDM